MQMARGMRFSFYGLLSFRNFSEPLCPAPPMENMWWSSLRLPLRRRSLPSRPSLLWKKKTGPGGGWGIMGIIDFIEARTAIKAILKHLGLWPVKSRPVPYLIREPTPKAHVPPAGYALDHFSQIPIHDDPLYREPDDPWDHYLRSPRPRIRSGRPPKNPRLVLTCATQIPA